MRCSEKCVLWMLVVRHAAAPFPQWKQGASESCAETAAQGALAPSYTAFSFHRISFYSAKTATSPSLCWCWAGPQMGRKGLLRETLEYSMCKTSHSTCMTIHSTCKTSSSTIISIFFSKKWGGLNFRKEILINKTLEKYQNFAPSDGGNFTKEIPLMKFVEFSIKYFTDDDEAKLKTGIQFYLLITKTKLIWKEG